MHIGTYSMFYRYNPLNVSLILMCLTVVVAGDGLDVDQLGDENGEATGSWLSLLLKIYSAVNQALWKLSSIPISPFLWLTQWLWRNLVLTPLTMATQATNIIYPVLIYCGAACVCGLIIGGFSGFAVEAMSSAMTGASRGKQHIIINKTAHHFDEKHGDNSNTHTISQVSAQSSNGDDMEADWRRLSYHSPSSSLYRLSISSDRPPYSFYDGNPNEWNGDEDPEEIASFLRQRRKLEQQQQG